MSSIGFVSSSQRLLAATAIATCAIVGAANATVVATVTYSPYGLPTPTGAINTIDLTGDVGQNNFTVNSGANAVTISAAKGGAVVQGSSTNNYAAPVTGGTPANPTVWTAPYLSSGGTPGSITLTFASPESYFGLLWGSIGSGDLLSFVDSTNTTIATVTGTEAMNALGYNGDNGAQGFGGSQYTLVNLTGGQFNKVIISQTGGPSFEAANFEYAAQNVSAVPEPASMALLGAGLVGLSMVRRRKSV